MEGTLQSVLGDPVTDAEEDAFLVFSQDIPSQTLGFIDSKAATLELTVAGRHLTIHHSRGLLTSNRSGGTTGAVVWKVTPLLAEWIASNNFLADIGYLSSATVALELGAGVSGIVASTLGPLVKRYIATDQDYVIRILKQNISENLPTPPPARKTVKRKANSKDKASHIPGDRAAPCIETLQLDWEADCITSLPSLLDQGQISAEGPSNGVDLIIACDCIYNDMLIEPFNTICAQICRLRCTDQGGNPTLCVIAQQLRSHEVFESWLKDFHRSFHVWQVPDKLLTAPLRENTGYIVHVGILRK